ncbi:ribonuclease P protein component [Companilactobacillus jidongensis]|uniref:ribonuclease P protein component n=1 Tax=Companilactobacillus jidongensis TaxID=2486006 RepID=UPI000F7AB81D|nr:ribonuclease P protein component [Companilactobacillus jidongensis]
MRKSYRIKKENEYQYVYSKGKSFANRNFVLYTMPKEGQKHFRVGLSVGKKVSHTAVGRNRVKRYVRQSLLELKPEIPAELDFLIIARKPSVDLDMFETKKNIVHLLKLGKIVG